MKNKVYAQLLGFAIFTGGIFNASEICGAVFRSDSYSGMAFWDCCICDVMSVKNTKRF